MSAFAPTFLEQQNKLSRILGDSDDESDSLWPAADRKFEINQGELMFAEDSKSVFRRVEGTVSSQAISLPTGFKGIHVLIVNDVVLTNDHEIPLEDWERFKDAGDDKYYFWTDTSDTRKINFIDSATDGLAYILFYFAIPSTELSADGDESILQGKYRMGPVYYAAKELLPMAGKTELAAYYEGEYGKLVIRAKDEAENLVKSVIKAMPDVFPINEFDRDKQGVGSYPGPGF